MKPSLHVVKDLNMWTTINFLPSSWWPEFTIHFPHMLSRYLIFRFLQIILNYDYRYISPQVPSIIAAFLVKCIANFTGDCSTKERCISCRWCHRTPSKTTQDFKNGPKEDTLIGGHLVISSFFIEFTTYSYFFSLLKGDESFCFLGFFDCFSNEH